MTLDAGVLIGPAALGLLDLAHEIVIPEQAALVPTGSSGSDSQTALDYTAPGNNIYVPLTFNVKRDTMFPTRILLAVDGSKETPSAVRAAVELASGTNSEMHVVHVVCTVPGPPYPHFAAKERSEAILEWRKLKGLEFLDEQVKRIGEDLGGSVAASYYREGKPEAELLRLGREIDAGLIVMGGRRRTRLERVLGMNSAEKVLRRADRPVLVVGSESSRSSAVPR